MKTIILLLIIFTLTSFSLEGIKQKKENEVERSNYYLGLNTGVAALNDQNYTAMFSANFNVITKSSRFFQVRTSFLGFFNTELVEQVGVVVGKSKNHQFYHINYGIGLSIVEIWNGEGGLFAVEEAVMLKRTVGVPFTLEFTGKLYLIGIGISINGNLNYDKPFIALGLKYSLGKLY